MDNLEYIFRKVYNTRNLSYRYYGKLKDEPKAILDEANLLPGVKNFAIQLYRTGITMKMAIKISKSRWDDYSEWCLKRTVFHIPEKEKYALKELQFRGFVREEDFPIKPKKYDYIMTNKMLDGSYWVYPKKYAKNYKQMTKGFTDIHNEFPKVALEGYTKIRYSDGYQG